MPSIPLDRTFRKEITTNVTIDLYGPWEELVSSLPADSDLVRINLQLALGNNNMPNDVAFNIGVGPSDPPTIVMPDLRISHEQVGAFSGDGAFGDWVIPFLFNEGDRIWSQIKGEEGPGGAFDFRIQLVFSGKF